MGVLRAIRCSLCPTDVKQRAAASIPNAFNRSSLNIQFLNGNVSEIVIDPVTDERCVEYGIKPQKKPSELMFALGSNYYMDVKSAGDDQYNAIFYKLVMNKTQASLFVGFRLVYHVKKMD